MGIDDGFVDQLYDADPGETREWLDSLDAVASEHGVGRAEYLI
jgi:pyruvate dehydrogenase E1 component